MSDTITSLLMILIWSVRDGLLMTPILMPLRYARAVFFFFFRLMLKMRVERAPWRL